MITQRSKVAPAVAPAAGDGALCRGVTVSPPVLAPSGAEDGSLPITDRLSAVWRNVAQNEPRGETASPCPTRTATTRSGGISHARVVNIPCYERTNPNRE